MTLDPKLQAPTHPGVYRTRDDIARMFCPGRYSAEIGVANGAFSRFIVAQRSACHYLIDPWEHQPDNVYPGDTANVPSSQLEAAYASVAREFNSLPNAIVVRGTGFDAVSTFPNLFFNFIFIDAIHTVAMVMADAVSWWPKLCYGGVLAFHDYNLGEMPGCPALSVAEALRNFLHLLHRQQLDIVTEDQESCGVIKF